jgi:hypothetical protein
MPEAAKEPFTAATQGDVVLKEIWRAKDTLSAAYHHDLTRMFAEARERQKHSGHPVVDLSQRGHTAGG